MSYSLTFRDAIEHATQFVGGQSHGTALRDSRLAVVSALRQLHLSRDWAYYRRPYRFQLTAPYSTGTLTYDHSGGASERLVTFSEALPAAVQDWAPSASLRAEGVVSHVERLLSSTTVQLDDNYNPGEDLAAGTTFELYRDSYTLPETFDKLGDLYHQSVYYRCTQISSDEFLALDRLTTGASDPYCFTIMADPRTLHRKAIWFYPHPAVARTLDTIMEHAPRELRVTGFAEEDRVGTVTVSSSPTTAISGTGTSFSSRHAGSLLRFGTTAHPPTDLLGDHPYQEEVILRTVTNATTLVSASNVGANYSAVKFVISDPIDIDPRYHECLLRGIEAQMVRLKRRPPAEVREAEAAYRQAWTAAASADHGNRTPLQFGARAPSIRLSDMPWGADE